MGAKGERFISQEGGWTIEGAEALLGSLTGVVAVRVVAKPGGEVEEIHLLTTDEVSPKQTVRNVESALLAHFNLHVDHRTISVAQTKERPSEEAVIEAFPARPLERRILFVGHQVETERSHRVRFKVTIEWRDGPHVGEAEAADLARPRMEAAANATLRAVEDAIRPELNERVREGFALVLDGVKHLDAFEKTYALVAVQALSGRDVSALAGAAAVEDSPDRAVIMATLQATDRWVRGRV
jgi:hypothetical protein